MGRVGLSTMRNMHTCQLNPTHLLIGSKMSNQIKPGSAQTLNYQIKFELDGQAVEHSVGLAPGRLIRKNGLHPAQTWPIQVYKAGPWPSDPSYLQQKGLIIFKNGL